MFLVLASTALAASPFSYGGTFSIKGAHDLDASADACTYAILPLGGDLCAPDIASATVTASGRLRSGIAGGSLVVITVPTHLTANAHDEREDCGLADANVEGAHTMTYTAVGSPDSVMVQGMLVLSHLGDAVEEDWQDPAAIDHGCRPHAGGWSSNETSGTVTIVVPFQVEIEGTYLLSLQAAGIGAVSDWTWNVLKVNASGAGVNCEVATDGTSMDTCTAVTKLGKGAHTLAVTVAHSSGMVVDSEAHPSEMFTINDLFTASFVLIGK